MAVYVLCLFCHVVFCVLSNLAFNFLGKRGLAVLLIVFFCMCYIGLPVLLCPFLVKPLVGHPWYVTVEYPGHILMFRF